MATQRERVLLPLALGPGDRQTSTLPLPIPVDVGRYEITLAPARTPDMIVGRALVRVLAGGAAGEHPVAVAHSR